MIISNLSIPMLGLFDTAILGHLENAVYLAAVAVGSTILSLLYWGFGFLRMGTTGITAQARGANNHDQSHLILAQSMLLGLCLGLLVLCISPWALQYGLLLIGPPAGAAQLAFDYSQIRIFSAPVVLINYAIIGWLIGRQNTRWPLILVLFTNGINILLDLVFIIGLKMNCAGAAYATLIAEYCGCGLGLWMVQRLLRKDPGQLHFQRLWRWQNYHQLLLINRHLFVRTLTLLSCLAFFTAQGSRQGDVVLAANTIIMNLLLLTSFGLDGFAHAAEALVGNAVGKRNHTEFINICYTCGIWSLAAAIVFSLFYWVLGPVLILGLTSIEEVRLQASLYLPWLLVLPLVAIWSYLLDGIFIGATQTAAMQTTMLLSAGLVYLPCWYFTQSWGNHGLWFAFISFNAARGLSLAMYFHRYNQRQCWW